GLTDRMFLARNGTVMTLILKNSPLSDDEGRTLAATCGRRKFGIVYAPVTASHPQPPNRNDYTRLITTDNTDRFYRTYYFDITPTTDDRPFFFHTLFPGQTTMKFDRTLLFGSGYETLRTVLVLFFVRSPSSSCCRWPVPRRSRSATCAARLLRWRTSHVSAPA